MVAKGGGALDPRKFRKCFSDCGTNIESGVGGRLMRGSKYVAFVPFTSVCGVLDFGCEIVSAYCLQKHLLEQPHGSHTAAATWTSFEVSRTLNGSEHLHGSVACSRQHNR